MILYFGNAFSILVLMRLGLLSQGCSRFVTPDGAPKALGATECV